MIWMRCLLTKFLMQIMITIEVPKVTSITSCNTRQQKGLGYHFQLEHKFDHVFLGNLSLGNMYVNSGSPKLTNRVYLTPFTKFIVL